MKDQPFPGALSAPFEPLARRVQAEATVVDDRILKIDHLSNVCPPAG